MCVVDAFVIIISFFFWFLLQIDPVFSLFCVRVYCEEKKTILLLETIDTRLRRAVYHVQEYLHTDCCVFEGLQRVRREGVSFCKKNIKRISFFLFVVCIARV